MRSRPSARVCGGHAAEPAPPLLSARPMLAAMPSVSARTGLKGAAGKQGNPSGSSSRRYAVNALRSAHGGWGPAGRWKAGEGVGGLVISIWTDGLANAWSSRTCHRMVSSRLPGSPLRRALASTHCFSASIKALSCLSAVFTCLYQRRPPNI